MVAVRPKKTAPNYKKPAQIVPAQHYTFPAPTNGLVLNQNISSPMPASALVLDNWICTAKSIRARGGFQKYATIASGAPVVSMFTYRSGALEKQFAATDSAVFEITSVADPDTIPTAQFSGQSSGYYSATNFGTVSGNYLYIANGTNSVRRYDGTSWLAITGASSPAITGVTTSTLSHVWSYASRLWFIQGGTTTAWYLPVDSLGGAALSVSLAGVFKKGGSLLFGASWSVDAGDGYDDKCIFVSTEGEVAVYAGIDPASASTWSLQGVYEISRPLGKNAIMKAGGDLLIATEVGLVPLSEAIKRDVAALSLGAVSRRIEPYWQEKSSAHRANLLPWEIERWPSEGIMVVTQPETVSGIGTLLVANLQTGAWSRFTGLGARCLAHYDGAVFAGSETGIIYRLQGAGSDDGSPYTCTYLGQHEHLGFPGEKELLQMRPMFTANIPIKPQISALVNYSETLSSQPNAFVYSGTDGWDISTWDSSVWDAAAGVAVVASDSQWVAVGRFGHALAPEIQITLGSNTVPEIDLVGMDATFRQVAMVA